MKLLALTLILIIMAIQYQLWNGTGGLFEITMLRQEIKNQLIENKKLFDRNQAMEAEIRDLKSGLDAAEERARMELGMIKKDESFFLVIDK